MVLTTVLKMRNTSIRLPPHTPYGGVIHPQQTIIATVTTKKTETTTKATATATTGLGTLQPSTVFNCHCIYPHHKKLWRQPENRRGAIVRKKNINHSTIKKILGSFDVADIRFCDHWQA
jgi:hypothetical protein